MSAIAKMFRQELPPPSWEAQVEAPAALEDDKRFRPQTCIHTLLGAGLRIEGNVMFTGGLRIEGAIVGNVSAVGDSNNTLMVSKSGNITGEIISQHVIVDGQIRGDVHCARSLEILKHGEVRGNILGCKVMEIHPGGIVDGSLIRTSSPLSEVQSRAQPSSIKRSSAAG